MRRGVNFERCFIPLGGHFCTLFYTAAIYGHIRKSEVSKEVITFEQFREAQTMRDALALKIVDTPAHYQPFFNMLNIKEDKLLDHAVAGELRDKVQAYAQETEAVKRATQALELKKLLTHPNDYRIFKESGLDPKQLERDIGIQEKVKSQETTLAQEPRTPQVPQPPKPAQLSPEDIKARAALLNTLSDLQMKSKPLVGMPAEFYLRHELKLKGEFSSDLRYLAQDTTFMDQGERKALPHACLIAFERDRQGKLYGAQLTPLTDNGKPVLDTDGQTQKQIQYGTITKSIQDYVKPSLQSNMNKPYQDLRNPQTKAEFQKSAPLTKSSASSPDNALGIITQYIGDKIREIKSYEGTSLAREAKEELRSYLETFQKDGQTLRDFKNQYPELAKDIQRLYQKQHQHNHELHRSKDRGMDM